MKRRATSPAKAASAAKRQETNELTDSLRVVSKVLETLEDLPPMVRAMLMDMLPTSLGTAREERHPFQTSAVEMVAGVFANVAAGMQDEITAEEVNLSGAGKAQDEREKAVAVFERIIEERLQVTALRKASLADSARDFRAAKAAAAEAAANAQRGGEDFRAAATKKDLLASSLKDSIQPLCEGVLPDVEVKDRVSSLVSFLKGYDFEDSILQALPTAFAVAPASRGQFDNVVVSMLTEGVTKRLQDLGAVLQNGEAANVERQRSVDEADAARAAAMKKQIECAKAFTAAKDAQDEDELKLNDAKQRLRDLGPEMKKVTKTIEQLQKRLARFQEGPLATFSELQNPTKTTPMPVAEDIAEAMDATSPSPAKGAEPAPASEPSPAKAAETALAGAASVAGVVAAGA